MTVTEKIIESVRDSRLTAAQIITQLDAKPATVMSLLHRLVKNQRILRAKGAPRAGRGPKEVFVYYLADDKKTTVSNQYSESPFPAIYRLNPVAS